MATIAKFITRPKSLIARPKINMTLLNKITCESLTLPDNRNTIDGTLFKFSIRSATNRHKFYDSQVWLGTIDIIHSSTYVKFRCTCKDFIYRFEDILYDNKSLLGIKISPTSAKDPTLYICKHLEFSLHFILKYGNIERIQKYINRTGG